MNSDGNFLNGRHPSPVADETRDERRARLRAERARRRLVYVGVSEIDAADAACTARSRGLGARIVRRSISAMSCIAVVFVVVAIEPKPSSPSKDSNAHA